MVQRVAFKTRARTVDHLGREQIADCPTAVSELWKNAYDAYARRVDLHIFDGAVVTAAVFDDGHGMSAQEFIDKWLVIGTESKAIPTQLTPEDMNGLVKRPKQGQKGIGRLSCANLGPLLLVVSKRRGHEFVAALLDWRLFENPFLLLPDITVPVETFSEKQDLFRHLPALFDQLMANVWGSGEESDKARDERIKDAWEKYTEFEKEQFSEEGEDFVSTHEKIANTAVNTVFDARQLEPWFLWQEIAETGTALLIGDVDFDLASQLATSEKKSSVSQAKSKFFETLSSFVDPFSAQGGEPSAANFEDEFCCSVYTWTGSDRQVLIGGDREFDISTVAPMEHILDGIVEENGTFRGRIKAFGEWLPGEVEIPVKEDIDVPKRADTKVGPFRLYTATMEWMLRNSSHTPEEHARFMELAHNYAGFMMYRDGLRVMPYGREDSDFFEIEQRRSRHAGREFWNHRQMFGRVAITRADNPNLKDKAGREGLIDNRATKALKDIVENILMTSARRYFGTASEDRKAILKERNKEFLARKAEEERKKVLAKRRREFRTNLRSFAPEMEELAARAKQLLQDLGAEQVLADELKLRELREQIMELKEERAELVLGRAPKNLGKLEQTYHGYRENSLVVQETVKELSATVTQALNEVSPKSPAEIVVSDRQRHAAFLHKRIRNWASQITQILSDESTRFKSLLDQRNKIFHEQTASLLDDVENERMQLGQVLSELLDIRDDLDAENQDIFLPYLRAVQSLQESIDLEGIAIQHEEEVSGMREELDRLYKLAQLGITIEVIGHELNHYDEMIWHGLNSLPSDAKETDAYKNIHSAYNSFSDRLKFLDPLKLSSARERDTITGAEIVQHIEEFFAKRFERNDIVFAASPQFMGMKVQELRSRIYPVFINLINNARYWVCQAEEGERRITIDVVDGKVVVGDTGPGVESEDLDHLFTLFFTRKVRGGRGVGLYLCRQNLAVGGHRIHYATDDNETVTGGANFVIDFRGATYA